ncbi:MAG: global cell cycle regulator GcrA-like protein [Alphaproteobacteria bacterium]|nr:global cell cycle regulator GcrA-like protein [Alphaproteobacteria bacterium]
MNWTRDGIRLLERLWKEGLTTAEIGRRLGMSKNAIVGKAHRLVLPPRPSPIRRKPEVVIDRLPGPACQWPHGDPGDPEFRFCGKRAVSGKPYCGEHYLRAYVGVTPVRDVNAA